MGNCPTPLRRATRFNEIDRARKVLDDAGVSAADLINNDHAPDCILGSCSREQGNCFYYAVFRGRKEIIELMLKHGADVHSTGAYDEPCLHCAIRHNHVEIVRMLIQAGSDVNATDDMGNLPIHCTGTSYYNTSQMIKYLLEEVGERSDVNKTNFNGRTPLHWAAAYGNVDVCDTLISYGADLNAATKTGQTPLHLTKKANVFDLLVSKGADPEAKTNSGYKPTRPTQNPPY